MNNDFPIDEKKLIDMIQDNPLEFMTICLNKSETSGKFNPVCKYVQLSVLVDKGEKLNDNEIELLEELKKKYGEINVSHFNAINNTVNRVPSVANAKEELKLISQSIKESIQLAHEKEPNNGHAALLEYSKSIAKNIKEDRGLKYCYENSRDMYECIQSFKGKKYKLSESIYITLKPKAFIHILVGHMENYLIPRKGRMVKFSNIKDWKELLKLIDRIIGSLSSELTKYFNSNKSGFNKTNYEFENRTYGIHLSRNGEIKTFYEVENTSANIGA